MSDTKTLNEKRNLMLSAILGGGLGGRTEIVSEQPVITAGAYTIGDALGGRLEFESALLPQSRTGVLQSMIIIDDAAQSSEIELWLFNSPFTAVADNAAWAPTEADLENLIGVVSTSDGAYYLTNGSAEAVCAVRNIGMPLKSTETTLYGQLVIRSGKTYSAVDDITVKLGILQD